MSDVFERGDWVLYSTDKNTSFGYILETATRKGGSMKVHMIEEDLNNFAGNPKYRWIEETSQSITKFNEPDVDYTHDIEHTLRPLLVDHYLKTKDFDSLKNLSYYKKNTMES